MVERVSRIAGMVLGGLLCVAVAVRLAPQALRDAREVLSEAVRGLRDRVRRLLPGRRRPEPGRGPADRPAGSLAPAPDRPAVPRPQ